MIDLKKLTLTELCLLDTTLLNTIRPMNSLDNTRPGMDVENSKYMKLSGIERMVQEEVINRLLNENGERGKK